MLPVIKRIVFLFFILPGTTFLMAQKVDTLVLIDEMARLKNFEDSIRHEQLLSDSMLLEKERAMLMNPGPDTIAENQKSAEQAFDEAIERMDKEEKHNRKLILLAVAGCFAIMMCMRMVMAKQKKLKV